MPTHVALLRAINVGGRARVAMADLRRIVADLGHTDVATYIQSGNVVFTSASTDSAVLAVDIRTRLVEELGVRTDVVVLTRDDLEQVIAGNPFPVTDPKLLHVVLRDTPYSAAEVEAVTSAEQKARERGSPDQAVVRGRALYLHTPGGFGRSELAKLLSRGPRAVLATATARNWATMRKLQQMLAAAD